jgi:SAM-dependent methyltransferase
MSDRHFFGPFFQGSSWCAWRVFLKALFALPMDTGEREIYHECTQRTVLPTEPFREAALVVGRRGGKSRVLALVAAYLATSRDYTPHLAPGEVATIAVIAADRKQARAIFRFAIGLLRAVPLLAPMVLNDTDDTITLSNRVRIEIHTASFRVTRGYTFAAVLADETAFWRDDTSANPDQEIFRALRPGLSTIPGAMLLNASSPYRKAGVLYTTFRRHYGRDDGRVLVWQGPTARMNPSLDPAVIAEAYEDDPASAAAEYGAEFRDDITDFVPREVIDACTIRGRVELLPVTGIRYSAFTDPAGGSGTDSMTLAICHAERASRVLDAVREIRPPFSPNAAVGEFAALLKTYRISSVVGDRYAGEWPRESFSGAGIKYELSDRPKGEIYRDTLPLLNSGNVELLDIPRLASQFCGLERRTARGGRDSIDHAAVGAAHDDVSNAVAGALLLLGAARAPMRISPEAMVRLTARPRAALFVHQRA